MFYFLSLGILLLGNYLFDNMFLLYFLSNHHYIVFRFLLHMLVFHLIVLHYLFSFHMYCLKKHKSFHLFLFLQNTYIYFPHSRSILPFLEVLLLYFHHTGDRILHFHLFATIVLDSHLHHSSRIPHLFLPIQYLWL